MPLPSLKHISPYEKLNGHPLDNQHLKTFGCLCFISTLKQGRKTFQPKANPCIFLGYLFVEKAYKVYNL